MWTEFTRETPARRGLALVAAAMAFGATTALAWEVTKRRTHPEELNAPQLPAFWPIKFSLPLRAQPINLGQLEIDGQRELSDGLVGIRAYSLGEPGKDVAVILVAYQLMAEGTTPFEAWQRFANKSLDEDIVGEGDPVGMGPLVGQMWDYEVYTHEPRIVAVGCLPSGLAIKFEYQAKRSGAHDGKLFRDICRSIRFAPWWLPRE